MPRRAVIGLNGLSPGGTKRESLGCRIVSVMFLLTWGDNGMAVRFLVTAAGLTLAAVSFTAPASAAGVDRTTGLNDTPTSWARMTRHRSKMGRRIHRNRGAGTASASAPNGRGYGMGPTGQPSGVK